MKRAVLMLVALIFIISALSGCHIYDDRNDAGTSDDATESNIEKTETENNIEKPETEIAVKFMRFNREFDSYISYKKIPRGDFASSLIDVLEGMSETGQTVDKISDQTIDESPSNLPVEAGTMWIEANSKIYRINSDFTQICRVEGHLGKGYVLSSSEAIRTYIKEIWYYYPRDYYIGTYTKKRNVINIEHVYSSYSSVSVDIKNIEVINDYRPTNKITLELLSDKDQTVSVDLDCSQSNDNLAEGDQENVSLKAGIPKTVELSFGGWKDSWYWIDILVDNTRINLKIEPQT